MRPRLNASAKKWASALHLAAGYCRSLISWAAQRRRLEAVERHRQESLQAELGSKMTLEEELREMERQEAELIERLQRAQEMQRTAYHRLEHALGGPEPRGE